MLRLRAGRGELSSTVEGGWDERLAAEVRKWGAGEDFFAVLDGLGVVRREDHLTVGEAQIQTHLALADGVGGWSPQFDPSLFSQSLLFHHSLSAALRPSSHPSKHLQSAHSAVQSDDLVVAGSSTATAIALSDSRLEGINLGDSGACILRRDKLLWRSTEQTHFFNCPRQLAKVPQGNRGAVSDQVRDGEDFGMELEPGDSVILYVS